MKETRSILNSLVACGIALAMVSTLAAQTSDETSVKVVRMKGEARYKAGSGNWQPLKAGTVLHSGMVVQTASGSQVDLILGTAAAPAGGGSPSTTMSYQPQAEQNMVRIWENTLLGVDKLTETKTGADVVTETQLDLKAGRITGTVKKMSAASKYEVKIPNGVAGIRGTVYDITAEGVVKVLSGSVVVAYVGPNGAVVTQVVMGNQQFDTRTGVLSSLPPLDTENIGRIISQLRADTRVGPTPVSVNLTLQYISPH